MAFEMLKNRPRPYVMAHRGNSTRCPENTLAAFRRAVDDGADIIETDLHVTADGVIVCIHDGSVDRTTNGQGAVKTLTFEALSGLDACYGQAEFAGEGIPVLEEVLEWLPEHVGIALELKADDFCSQVVCEQLLNLLRNTGTLNRAIAISFSAARLAAIRVYTPVIPTGNITMQKILPQRGCEVNGPFWPLLFINPLYVYMAHRRGQLVAPLDPAPDSRLWYYRLLRCDVILTNDPGQTIRKLGR